MLTSEGVSELSKKTKLTSYVYMSFLFLFSYNGQIWHEKIKIGILDIMLEILCTAF